MEQSPKKRLISALQGKTVDRISCLSVTQIGTVELMDIRGSAWPAAHSNRKKWQTLPLQPINLQGLKLYVTPTA